jgi:glycosyltransferase involved in cell wall biosynthesis
VDAPAIRTAQPFAPSARVVLVASRLERAKGLERAIAAMAGVGPSFRLVIIGNGPERDRLQARAADLRISARVQFTGAVPDAILYRWLRTAQVVLTLAGEHGSGSLLAEARAAGAWVVASDIPVHRQAAALLGDEHVTLVAPGRSPLEVADAIVGADRVGLGSEPRALRSVAPSWDSVVERTWRLYEQMTAGKATPART